MMGTSGIMKCIKVLMYKVGLVYKRQEIYRDEIMKDFNNSKMDTVQAVSKETDSVKEIMQQVHDDLEEHTEK